MAVGFSSVLCLVIGHKRVADSRRNLNGSVFADCARCSRELYREPVKGKWRAATDRDRQPRGFALTEEALAPGPKTRSRRGPRSG